MATLRSEAPTPYDIRKDRFEYRSQKSLSEAREKLENWIKYGRDVEPVPDFAVEIKLNTRGDSNSEFLAEARDAINALTREYKVAGWKTDAYFEFKDEGSWDGTFILKN